VPDFNLAIVLALSALCMWAVLRVHRMPAAVRAMGKLDALASRTPLAVLLCAAFSFVGSGLIAWLIEWPQPRVHDEFSYLLGADTFASGRLTNPPHPMWEHFESFHIFFQPTYASKYPPASALVLALGQRLTGQPIVGVWLSGALMCGAICWMLYAWTPPRWAFLGGLAATAQLGIATYWTQSYWGGALTAGAAALVYGAAARLSRTSSIRDSFVFGVGLALLANTRPFEGALISLPAAVYVLAAIWRRRPRRALATLAPAGIVLAVTLGSMAYYDQVVVGHWWLPPYLHHEQLYAVRAPLRWLGKHPTPVYHHREMRWFWAGLTPDEREIQYETLFETGRHIRGWAMEKPAWRVGGLDPVTSDDLRKFFLSRMLVLPLLVGLASLGRPHVKLAAVGLAVGILALTATDFFQIHYAAPITAPLLALCAVGFARIEPLRWRGRPIGHLVCVALLLGTLAHLALDVTRVHALHDSSGTDEFPAHYAAVRARLTASPGRDLVIVQYGPAHDLNREWVYNRADIDASDIVWARDMGEERNEELIRYYPHRKVWLLRDGFVDDTDGLTPYPAPAGSVASFAR